MGRTQRHGLSEVEVVGLLDEFRSPRARLLLAHAKYPPTSPEYRALDHLRIALDAAAELLTGRRDTFSKADGPAPRGPGWSY